MSRVVCPHCGSQTGPWAAQWVLCFLHVMAQAGLSSLWLPRQAHLYTDSPDRPVYTPELQTRLFTFWLPGQPRLYLDCPDKQVCALPVLTP